ncbi:MAG: sigma-70 family RNA polymerase sigma factor [Lachnospiraceae bacterium]|nr:sigma-70 family RNA polymerase sigma factor [Lachnospiraceae bacterium]
MIITEDNVIQQLQKKNESALMYVIDEYGGLIKSVISKNMSCLREEQTECMNDVLLAIWEHIESFDPSKNQFKNWIAAIAKYKAIDYMRKYKKELSNISFEKVEHEKHYEDDIFTKLEDEISQRTNELLSLLKETDREIFIRLYVKEESLDTISKDLKMSKPTIYNRLSRARKKLRSAKGV